MKQIVFKISCILVCVSVMLSVFILPVSAFDEVQDKYIFELEGFPYHNNGNDASNYFANGVFISDASSGFQAYYYEFVFNSDNLFGSQVLFNPVSLFYKSDSYPYLILPSYNKSGTSSFTVPEACYIYDVNGNLVFDYSNPASFSGNKTGDFYPYSFSATFPSRFSTNGMFLSLSETFHNNLSVDTVVKGNNGYPSKTLTVREPLIMYPEIIINGYSYNGSNSGVYLTSKGDVEPVTDENGNITNYIINNEIDISPIIDVSPSTPLDDDSMNEFESAVGEVQSTIPEEDLSNMMGNVDMSGRPIEWIYQQLEDFVSGNNKVFSVYMAILSMSFIMFVLNKGSSVRGG